MQTMMNPDRASVLDRLRRRWRPLLLAVVLLVATYFIEATHSWDALYRFTGLTGDTLPQPPQGSTAVLVLDVGQGDAVLLLQDGEACLIDTGTADSADILLADLDELGVESLRYLVLTHPHADHTGGARAVLDALPVETLLLPYWQPEEIPAAPDVYLPGWPRSILQAAEGQGTAVTTAVNEQSYPLGSGSLTVLHGGLLPDESAPELTANVNNASLCTMFAAGDFRFLDTGDAEKEVEQLLADTYGTALRADLFKAGHHGSATSNTLSFLQLVRPCAVAVSCGLDNDYGHPHREALQSFAAVGAEIWRTDVSGTLMFIYDNGNLDVATASSVQEAA